MIVCSCNVVSDGDVQGGGAFVRIRPQHRAGLAAPVILDIARRSTTALPAA